MTAQNQPASSIFDADDDERPSNADVTMDTIEEVAVADGENSATNGHIAGADGDEGGLFGSDSDPIKDTDDEAPRSESPRKRRLSDEELDSGDDEDRHDRMDEDGEGYDSDKEKEQNYEDVILDLNLGRTGTLTGSDGEIYLLKYPQFMGVEHKRFDLKTFQPPTTEHHTGLPPSSHYSPSQVANNTIRWRRAPNDPKRLQSNARILRWSDGSLTLQLAANPMDQYELPTKPLAPPQYNPRLPTPTSINSRAKPAPRYEPRLDSHTYLAVPHIFNNILRTTRQITASVSVQTTNTANIEDDALIRLQESLAASARGSKPGATEGRMGIIDITEDPELAKKKAELAEKEKLRAQKRRQNQEERERDRANRVLGRSGLRTGGYSTGLTIGGLEDDDGIGGGRSAGRAKITKPKRPRRRNDEYSDEEEEYGHQGRTKEDEYDKDDGFLVGSDEEEDLVEDDEEEEDVDEGLGGVDDAEGEDDDEEVRRPAKRVSPVKAPDADEDRPKSGGREDGAGAARGKRRRVVSEDEDDD
ncbi:hypothetical protein MMC25_006114 [Agyrium rufum]|nr:hypothetical protein [Agyrium rufum]